MNAKTTLNKALKEKNEKRAIAQELVDQLSKMRNDRDSKCASAKEQLIESLKITADKYLTATGVMEALRVLRLIDEDGANVDNARNLAIILSNTANKMAKTATDLDYADMDQLCDGFYDKEFAREDIYIIDFANQLMLIDLCRNVGPAAEDMVEFLNRTNEEIDDTQAELDKMIDDNPDFKDLTPTEFKDK